MAIRHLALIRVNGDTEAERTELADELTALLEGLQTSVPNILSLSVQPNAGTHPTNWDLQLICDFADLEQLDAYRLHPAHVALVEVLDRYVAEIALIDTEI